MTRRPEARVLLVDDEPSVTESLRRSLHKEPFEVATAESGVRALEILARDAFDVVVSDERMAGMQGSELLTVVRERHPDVGRIILSGHASFEAALRAINAAEIHRFLVKPCPADEVALTIRDVLDARERRRQRIGGGSDAVPTVDGERLATFERVLESTWMGFQPIVDAATGDVHAFEALLRGDDPSWRGPLAVFDEAAALDRSLDVARRVRRLVALRMPDAPRGTRVFVNANPHDLDDATFVDGLDELGEFADRVVVEITERDSLSGIAGLEDKIRRLRRSGYRIALDDFGAGYSGLGSMAFVVPNVVKFDMSLVRGIDRSPTKRKLIAPMVEMCRSLDIDSLAEGVETEAERATLVGLGCTFLQGFLLGHPARGFRAARS